MTRPVILRDARPVKAWAVIGYDGTIYYSTCAHTRRDCCANAVRDFSPSKCTTWPELRKACSLRVQRVLISPETEG